MPPGGCVSQGETLKAALLLSPPSPRVEAAASLSQEGRGGRGRRSRPSSAASRGGDPLEGGGYVQSSSKAARPRRPWAAGLEEDRSRLRDPGVWLGEAYNPSAMGDRGWAWIRGAVVVGFGGSKDKKPVVGGRQRVGLWSEGPRLEGNHGAGNRPGDVGTAVPICGNGGLWYR